jgi:DNA modification methylase
MPNLSATADDYQAFLEAKVPVAESDGIALEPAALSAWLKPHCRVIVPWMVRGGRRAVFASFGLHKTAMQLEAVWRIMERIDRPGLITIPLGVKQEFTAEAAADRLNMPVKFIRHPADIDPHAVNLTNYETVRDGKLDPALFGVASLDEASVLRGFGGTKTFREFMKLFAAVPYRFVATATPSPNEFIELLAYAAFLGIMDVGEAKTRFFKRDSEHADQLTLHEHKQEEFWLWVASWAIFISKPSDLGFSDEGYVLPELDVRWHEVPSDHSGAGAEKNGQGKLLRDSAKGLVEAAAEKRDSLPRRIERMIQLIRDGGSRVSSAILQEEPRAVASGAEGAGRETPAGAARLCEEILFREQGEAAAKTAGEKPEELCGEAGQLSRSIQGMGGEEPGEVAGTSIAALAEEPGKDDRGQSSLVPGQQAARGGDGADPETPPLWFDGDGLQRDAGSAGQCLRDLRHEAASEEIDRRDIVPHRSLPQDGCGSGIALPALQHGIGAAGGLSESAHAGAELSEQIIVWCDLNDEQGAVEKALNAEHISFSSLYGNQDIDERERLLALWRAKSRQAFVTKPKMYGAGINMQQCHWMIFVGIGFKFADLFQAIHRCHRFGQKHPVRVDLIFTEAERSIRTELERKWADHLKLQEVMTGIIKQYGLNHADIAGAMKRSMGVQRQEVTGLDYRLVNNDCVIETRGMAANSVDLIVTSIPFSTQYEYTPSYNDFGHSESNEAFWRQMDFLTPQLLRVLKPGRCAAIHVKDRIVPGGMTGLGFQTVYRFSDACADHFEKHGFAFIGRQINVTDVVRENAQTYRLGWSEQCKDGTRMGCGMPEYILYFRKAQTDRSKGYADQPVVKEKRDARKDPNGEVGWSSADGYSRARWQLDAAGFWRSSGDRLLQPEDLVGLDAKAAYRMWKRFNLQAVYDHEHHVAVAEARELKGQLPPDFALLPIHSWHPEIWTDVAQMRSLNTMQSQQGAEKHLCPLPFDIVNRIIRQRSMPGETVLDPFGGLMTVPYCALKLGRKGIGIELNPRYFADGCKWVEAVSREAAVPTLFDLLAAEQDEDSDEEDGEDAA